MSNYYNLEGIKTELNKRLSYEKSILQAWENVTFPTKKDGTPFKVIKYILYHILHGEMERKIAKQLQFVRLRMQNSLGSY